MEQRKLTCVDCMVKNCSAMDKTYPDFCLTTHMDEQVLQEAMACYEAGEDRAVMIAASE